MNFISSFLGRRRDDGASTEPLTTAELLGLRDAALRVGRRWLESCEDDGAVRTLAGPCGRDALEATCAAASHRGTTDDDAIALGARRALESMVLTDDSSEAAPGDVEDLATLACVVRLFVDDDAGAAALVRTLADACDSRRMPAAGRAVAEAVAVAYSTSRPPSVPRRWRSRWRPSLQGSCVMRSPARCRSTRWSWSGITSSRRAKWASSAPSSPAWASRARRWWPPRAGGRRATTAAALAHDVVSDLCRDADAGALAREIERLSRREDVSAVLGDLRHTVGTAATLTRAELRRRLSSYDVDGDGVLEASEALDAARALGADDEDTSLVARAAVLAARSGSVTVAALERAALGDDYVARCLGGAVDPAGGSTAAPSESGRPRRPRPRARRRRRPLTRRRRASLACSRGRVSALYSDELGPAPPAGARPVRRHLPGSARSRELEIDGESRVQRLHVSYVVRARARRAGRSTARNTKLSTFREAAKPAPQAPQIPPGLPRELRRTWA